MVHILLFASLLSVGALASESPTTPEETYAEALPKRFSLSLNTGMNLKSSYGYELNYNGTKLDSGDEDGKTALNIGVECLYAIHPNVRVGLLIERSKFTEKGDATAQVTNLHFLPVVRAEKPLSETSRIFFAAGFGLASSSMKTKTYDSPSDDLRVIYPSSFSGSVLNLRTGAEFDLGSDYFVGGSFGYTKTFQSLDVDVNQISTSRKLGTINATADFSYYNLAFRIGMYL